MSPLKLISWRNILCTSHSHSVSYWTTQQTQQDGFQRGAVISCRPVNMEIISINLQLNARQTGIVINRRDGGSNSYPVGPPEEEFAMRKLKPFNLNVPYYTHLFLFIHQLHRSPENSVFNPLFTTSCKNT